MTLDEYREALEQKVSEWDKKWGTHHQRPLTRVCAMCGHRHSDRDTTVTGLAPGFSYYCPACAGGVNQNGS